ncbi:MAG TPA: hypothetical protein VFX85_05125 [Solirubrobacterales bacterium]|nr:hypothetical protein [Solirubrobacterales bacterium]
MTKLPSRLPRHLSYANVMASVAVFLALGGVGYAAATINGNKIVKGTIGAGKLKNGTLTSAQVKQNALTGSVIDESTLTIVPSAQSANSATTAASANTAASADSAKTANTAKSAETAAHAASADTATEATTAQSAESAKEAEAVDGLTAGELQVSCPANTDLFGGMCWEQTPRPLAGWVVASVTCGDAGGRLPSLSELIAYIAQPGPPEAEHWSADVADFDAPENEEIALARGESGTSLKRAPVPLGYRCLFYRVN